MAEPQRDLLSIPMLSESTDIYSGVARAAKALWATRWSAGPADTVAVLVHPSSNFMGHYALPGLAARGIDAVGLTTRYLGNDSAMLLENCLLDLAAGIAHLRTLGYRRVVLVGNSGGGELAAMYQAQAERPSIARAPCGGGPDLTRLPVPPIDALVLLNAHVGRATILTESMDPAITDEAEPLHRDGTLDAFADANKPPYCAEFIANYRAAQRARNERITDWVEDQLDRLENDSGGITDLPFVVHGTCADLRMLDLTIEPSDRALGCLWGEVYPANFNPVSLGHHNSLRAWLSQWSLRTTNGDARRSLPAVSVPVLVAYATADQGCHPSHARALFRAVGHDRKQLVAIQGGTHYFREQPEQIAEVCDLIAGWARA